MMSRMFTTTTRVSWVLLLALGLQSCNNGGSSGGGGGGKVVNASPGGIWNGADPYSPGNTITGIITEGGELTFLSSDGVQYFGAVTTSGNSIAGTFTGVAPVGTAFSDGSTYGTGTIAGSINARNTMNVTVTFTTNKNSDLGSKSLSLNFDSLYDTASSLAAIAGNYLDPTDNSIVSVNASGVIFSQNATNGCVINGQVSLIDASYDAYKISYTFAGCVGVYAALNGTTATGLGALDATGTPVTAYVGVQDLAVPYVLTRSYQRQ